MALKDMMVVGLDKDGQVVMYDANNKALYASGEFLAGYVSEHSLEDEEVIILLHASKQIDNKDYISIMQRIAEYRSIIQ